MKLTYSQLEGVWIQAGGQKSLAPLMAAIALAESSGRSDALNPNDNNGRQSSYGLWQISTGNHNPPSPNWADPVTNAKLAIGKLKSQGLSAWGTYTSGAYKRFMANGVPPSGYTGSTTPVSEAGETLPNNICAWNVKLPAVGDTCILSKVQVRSLLAVTLIGTGAIVLIGGLAVLIAYGLGKKPTALLPKGVGGVSQSSGNRKIQPRTSQTVG